MTSASVEINGWPIWYEKRGTGPIPVLMIPGALGSGLSDFYEQLDGDEALDLQKYTLIAVEAPGWGRSRPPVRPYGSNIYDNDAECFHKLMNHLGYDKYYLIGWSDGAIVGLWMACKYPGSIQRMVIHGVLTFLYPRTLAVLKSTRNVESWGQEKHDCYLRTYKSKEELQNLWDRHLRYCDYFNSYFPMDTNVDHYKKVNFPILVIHGDRDPISTLEHPEYVIKHIKSAKLKRFPNGNHDLHIRYSASYKRIVEEFFAN
ncbi:valacyclovir hydrolase-like [Oppia nitens]|uniref:valacyclovir hydrolase-like n=1 Tax=Oppia nitens TaxID=1686743 RepID=UPI0023DC7F53|nr:valacyclovir hydrolase-like [Oppia nitens]